MKHSTARWTTAFAAFALLGLPAAGWSQPPPPTPSTTSQQPPSAAGPERHGAAQEHIRQAQAALNDVQTASLQGKPKTKVTELKRHLNSLEKSTASASTTASKTAARGKEDKWATEVSAIDKILTELLGPATTSATSAPAGATGTAGKTTPTSLTLDETTKSKLMEVRTHVIAFAASMSGAGAAAPRTGEPSSAPAAAAGATTAQPTATSAAQPQTPAQAPAQPSTPSTAAPTSATAPRPAQAQQPPAGTAQVDPEGAKRHLTAARDTLGQLTQLSAAAQVQGDARTQLSQLITNFNELITTNENWRSSYDKVNANVVALLGPETPEPSQPPAPVAPVAVGTSGTVAATLDPAVRAKLVEFRNHLTQFEKAAGADTPAASAASAATPAAAATVVTTTAPPSSPATEQSAAPPERSEVMGQNTALVHIDAIEAILKPRATASAQTPAGTPGTLAATGLTLDPSQVEQLRTHLAELRKAIEKK